MRYKIDIEARIIYLPTELTNMEMVKLYLELFDNGLKSGVGETWLIVNYEN